MCKIWWNSFSVNIRDLLFSLQNQGWIWHWQENSLKSWTLIYSADKPCDAYKKNHGNVEKCMQVFSSRFFGNIMRKFYFSDGWEGWEGKEKKQGVKKAERKRKYRVQSKFPKLKNVCQNKTICKSSLFGWSKPIRNLYVWKIPVKKPRDSVPLSPVLGMLFPKCFTWARQCLKCWGISLPPPKLPMMTHHSSNRN